MGELRQLNEQNKLAIWAGQKYFWPALFAPERGRRDSKPFLFRCRTAEATQ